MMLGLIEDYDEINPQLAAQNFFGTILEELDHWQEKQGRAVAKQYELVELIDAGKANDSAAHSLVALGETIKENAEYITQLESWQGAFESNPDKWLEDQMIYYTEKYADNQKLLSVIFKKINICSSREPVRSIFILFQEFRYCSLCQTIFVEIVLR